MIPRLGVKFHHALKSINYYWFTDLACDVAPLSEITVYIKIDKPPSGLQIWLVTFDKPPSGLQIWLVTFDKPPSGLQIWLVTLRL